MIQIENGVQRTAFESVQIKGYIYESQFVKHPADFFFVIQNDLKIFRPNLNSCRIPVVSDSKDAQTEII